MLCPQCGQENDAGDKFCADCGAKLKKPKSRKLTKNRIKRKIPKRIFGLSLEMILFVVVLAYISFILISRNNCLCSYQTCYSSECKFTFLGYKCFNTPLSGETSDCSGSTEDCHLNLCSKGECIEQVQENCCGNSECEEGENYNSCSKDCEYVESCGNGKCGASENKCTCPQDCGSCSGSAGVCRYFECNNNYCETKKTLNCCGNNICEGGENYNICAVDCEAPMEVQTIHILGDIGRTSSDGTFIFTDQDMISPNGGRYATNIITPITFNQNVEDVSFQIRCTLKEEGKSYQETAFSAMEDKETELSASYREDFRLNARASFWSADRNVMLNTGTSTGTQYLTGSRVLVADKGSRIDIRYHFFFEEESTGGTLDCTTNIVSDNPKQYEQVNFKIEYRD